MKKKRRRIVRFSHEKRNIFIFLLFVFFMGMGYSTLETSLGLGGVITILYPREPIIKATSLTDNTAFRSDTYREKIKIINLDNKNNPPANVIESWDISESGTGAVMAYITQNQTDSNYYDLYIQGRGGHLYANTDSSYLFANLKGVDAINNIEILDTSRVTKMIGMFRQTGYNSTSFTLDLGDNFDTSQVTDMTQMFSATGYNSTRFTLDLGENFDTSNVTNMSYMFHLTGYYSTDFTLDLGEKFDTSKVTNMFFMFYAIGYYNTAFSLDLGNKFNTSKVKNMQYMFYDTGFANTTLELDLSQLSFDSVTAYSYIFSGWRTTQTIFVKDSTARNWVITNSGNSNLTTSNVLIKGACTIEAVDFNDTSKFRNSQYRDKIHNIYLSKTISVPNNIVESWDISELQDGSVVAYLTSTQTDIYDLYIQGDGRLYANQNSSLLFYNLQGVDSINNLDALNTSNVVNMSNMFSYTGYNSTSFTLNLGNNFDTGQVVNMHGMFSNTGYSSTVFELDLGDKFDTSNVTSMSQMFINTGYSSTVFELDLGDTFNTSNVTNMSQMFYQTGRNSTVFTLDLEDMFVTSQVTDMSEMFSNTGRNSPVFTLDLEDNFDTSNVTSMERMFINTGYSSTVFVLDLGDGFDTSQVTDMQYMFYCTGYSSTSFTLDLGDNFDTSNVTNMSNMFFYTGYSSASFTLDLGDNFDTSNVKNMSYMFSNTGHANSTLELDLSTFTFNLTNANRIFDGWKTTQKIYVKDATAQNWIITKSGNNNLTNGNVLIKT